jgi:hypothetical protein
LKIAVAGFSADLLPLWACKMRASHRSLSGPEREQRSARSAAHNAARCWSHTAPLTIKIVQATTALYLRAHTSAAHTSAAHCTRVHTAQSNATPAVYLRSLSTLRASPIREFSLLPPSTCAHYMAPAARIHCAHIPTSAIRN